LKNQERKGFVYKDKGSMATIGRNRAIAEIGSWKLTGFIAWCAWLFVHIISLIGFRNRLSVMTQWMWAYFTRERSARLITGDAEEMHDAMSFIQARPTVEVAQAQTKKVLEAVK
jgi:NADH dehydrogenase